MRRQHHAPGTQIVLCIVLFHIAHGMGGEGMDIREIVTIEIQLHHLRQVIPQARTYKHIIFASRSETAVVRVVSRQFQEEF
jgi:hypothetical protein